MKEDDEEGHVLGWRCLLRVVTHAGTREHQRGDRNQSDNEEGAKRIKPVYLAPQ